MNKEKILDASDALDALEVNSGKLSKVITDISVFREDLTGLKSEVEKAQKINKNTDAKLSKLNKAVDEVHDKLTAELRVRLAEGLAEQTSRIKDGNEKLSKLEGKLAKIQSDLEQYSNKFDELDSKLNTTKNNLVSFRNLSLVLQVLTLAAVVYLAAEKFGLI